MPYPYPSMSKVSVIDKVSFKKTLPIQCDKK